MLDWQHILVTLIIAASAIYVARVVWRSVFAKEGGGCASCKSCEGKDKETAPKTLVTLDDRARPNIMDLDGLGREIWNGGGKRDSRNN